MQFKDQLILVTGATGGIGQAICHALAQEGSHLILVGRNPQLLQALQKSLNHPDRHRYFAVDLQAAQAITELENFVKSLQEQGHRIKVVINNAGRNSFAALEARTPQSIQDEIHLNLTVPMLLTRSAQSWLQTEGIVVNIGSALGSIGFPGYATYCASKSGLHRFSEAIDREWMGTGKRVLYLAPRSTQTHMNDQRVQGLNKALGNSSDSAETVATHLVSLLRKEQSSHWIGWPEKLLVKFNQLFPTVVSKSIYKQQTIIQQYIHPQQPL